LYLGRRIDPNTLAHMRSGRRVLRSLMASDRRYTGRDVLGRGKALLDLW
jgi:hypothetical protein